MGCGKTRLLYGVLVVVWLANATHTTGNRMLIVVGANSKEPQETSHHEAINPALEAPHTALMEQASMIMDEEDNGHETRNLRELLDHLDYKPATTHPPTDPQNQGTKKDTKPNPT